MKNFELLSTCTYADALESNQFMDIGIKEIWSGIPRIAGPAYTVQLYPGDNLMLHYAIHDAPKGSIIVVNSGDLNYAVAGGNVCAFAQKRGIKGFIVDGVIRDKSEIRNSYFPVFARGVRPKPGSKKHFQELNIPIICGGVNVNPGDIIVADEEGIVVIPINKSEFAYKVAKKRELKDIRDSSNLDSWGKNHYERITKFISNLKN